MKVSVMTVIKRMEDNDAVHVIIYCTEKNEAIIREFVNEITDSSIAGCREG